MAPTTLKETAMPKAKQEYTLHLTHAPNGGWVIRKNTDGYREHEIAAAYTNKSDMLSGLSDLIEEM